MSSEARVVRMVRKLDLQGLLQIAAVGLRKKVLKKFVNIVTGGLI